MALQLGFGDSVKLLNSDDASIREALSLTRDKYSAYVRAIDVGESDLATYWRIVFSILSVHSPIDATFEAYKSLRLWKARFGRVPSAGKLQTLFRLAHGGDGVIQYPYQKAQYVREFDAAWRDDRNLFTRNGETDDAWRARIQRNVRGLGLAKASFAVCLSSPASADVCCVDTHIYQLFTGKVPRSTIGRKVYLAIEEQVRSYAREFGLSVFACQWALWDAKRGVANDHHALATI
jgi:thermostable 8-oxoguanine DNA glycosylase